MGYIPSLQLEVAYILHKYRYTSKNSVIGNPILFGYFTYLRIKFEYSSFSL